MKLTSAVMRHAASQASRQLLEEEFPVESVVLDELQTQTVEQARYCSKLQSVLVSV